MTGLLVLPATFISLEPLLKTFHNIIVPYLSLFDPFASQIGIGDNEGCFLPLFPTSLAEFEGSKMGIGSSDIWSYLLLIATAAE